MKRLWLILLLVFILSESFSQQEKSGSKTVTKKFATGITLYHDIWQGTMENVTPRTINQGVDVFLMYNIPVERSPLLFCIGTGFSTHNFFSNALLGLDSANVYQFTKISSLTNNDGSGIQYKKNKLSVTYWDFPFEFRFESKGGFKLGAGMKFGFVLSSSTKYKGDDLDGSGNLVKIKQKDLRNMEKWRYGISGKIGYKWLELYGFYSLTTLFKKDQGPEMFPVSIGISLRPLFLN